MSGVNRMLIFKLTPAAMNCQYVYAKFLFSQKWIRQGKFTLVLSFSTVLRRKKTMYYITYVSSNHFLV